MHSQRADQSRPHPELKCTTHGPSSLPTCRESRVMWRHNTKLATVGLEAIAWACTSTAPWKLSGCGWINPLRLALTFWFSRPIVFSNYRNRSVAVPSSHTNRTSPPSNPELQKTAVKEIVDAWHFSAIC